MRLNGKLNYIKVIIIIPYYHLADSTQQVKPLAIYLDPLTYKRMPAKTSCLIPFAVRGSKYKNCTEIGYHIPWCPISSRRISNVSDFAKRGGKIAVCACWYICIYVYIRNMLFFPSLIQKTNK